MPCIGDVADNSWMIKSEVVTSLILAWDRASLGCLTPFMATFYVVLLATFAQLRLAIIWRTSRSRLAGMSRCSAPWWLITTPGREVGM
jgi:hypothetical protein